MNVAQCSSLGPKRAAGDSDGGQTDNKETQGIAAAAPSGNAPQTRCLEVEVQGCSDLRVLDCTRAKPYVCVRVRHALGAAESCGHSRPSTTRLGWLLETRPACGVHPVFGERTSICIGQGDALEVVVFDAGIDAKRDHGGGIIGAAEISSIGVRDASPGLRAVPLVHPMTGRHAGVLSLQLSWRQ